MQHRFPAARYVPPPVPMREQEFRQVREILNGAAELWNQLYIESYDTVLRCAKSVDCGRLLCLFEYYEIADEAFALCFSQLERYRGLSRFRYWVGGYAKNLTRNRCARKRTRLRNQRLLESMANTQMLGCDPLLVILRLERDQCLWGAFFDLAVLDRQILSASLFDHLAPRSIAHALQISRKEVLRRYDDALAAIRFGFLRRYNPKTGEGKERTDNSVRGNMD